MEKWLFDKYTMERPADQRNLQWLPECYLIRDRPTLIEEYRMANEKSSQGKAAFERHNPIPDEASGAVQEILNSGKLFRYAGDPDWSPATQLEKEFAAYVGTMYAVALHSCSCAISIALKLC